MRKINVISGKINSGKTTKLLQMYANINLGDGFILKKSYLKGQHVGQQVVRLSTGESKAFSYREGFVPPNMDLAYTYKSYSFTKTGLYFAEEIVRELIEKNIEPIFMDEIGPLELQETGFYKIFLLILETEKEIFLATRDSCLEQVIQKFQLQNYNVQNIRNE
jgi:nucleoside-triphosphatase THEP1